MKKLKTKNPNIFSKAYSIVWPECPSCQQLYMLLLLLQSDNPQMSLLCNCTNCFIYCLLHKQLCSYNKDLLPQISSGSMTKWIFLVCFIFICMNRYTCCLPNCASHSLHCSMLHQATVDAASSFSNASFHFTLIAAPQNPKHIQLTS